MMAALALFRASVRSALPLRRTALFVILEGAPALIYVIATSSRTEVAAMRGLAEIGMRTYFALVLPVVAIALAAGVLGNERRDLTMSFITLRPIPRPIIAVTKIAAAIVAATALNLIGALAMSVTHAARFGTWEVVLAAVVASITATVAYCAAFVPIGFLTDRAVIAGMAYLLVFENGVVFALTGLAFLSPWRLGAAVFAGIVDDAALYMSDAIGTLEPTRAVLVAAVYLLLGWAATSILLRTRDLA